MELSPDLLLVGALSGWHSGLKEVQWFEGSPAGSGSITYLNCCTLVVIQHCHEVYYSKKYITGLSYKKLQNLVIGARLVFLSISWEYKMCDLDNFQ